MVEFVVAADWVGVAVGVEPSFLATWVASSGVETSCEEGEGHEDRLALPLEHQQEEGALHAALGHCSAVSSS